MVVAFRSLDKGPPKSVGENTNRFGPFGVNWYTLFRNGNVISGEYTICRWCRERRRISYRFRQADATSILNGFVIIKRISFTSVNTIFRSYFIILFTYLKNA